MRLSNYIRDDSPDLDNLQLLCQDCHHAKTAEQIVSGNAEQRAEADALRDRVMTSIPGLLCDDEDRWKEQWLPLKKARLQRFHDRCEEIGVHVENFPGASRAEPIEELEDAGAPFDFGGRTTTTIPGTARIATSLAR